jgi:hypothetical protein
MYKTKKAPKNIQKTTACFRRVNCVAWVLSFVSRLPRRLQRWHIFGILSFPCLFFFTELCCLCLPPVYCISKKIKFFEKIL